MTMTMSEQPISVFDTADAEMTAARAAGWRRSDLRWERLQEAGNDCFESDDMPGAARAWRRAYWTAMFGIPAQDPRWATTLANLALADRQAGREARAQRRLARALSIWNGAHDHIETMTIARRARSSLFHLRMEALHWDTYRRNRQTRFMAFAAEAAGALDAMAHGEPAGCRLFARWRGEKPPVFDDTRKFLAAALLIGGGARQSSPTDRPRKHETGFREIPANPPGTGAFRAHSEE